MTARFAGLFPGQLSEKAGMGQALAARYPDAADLFDAISRRSGVDIPSTFFGAGAPDLHDDLPAQVGVFAVSVAVLQVLEREHRMAPHAVAGYSLGTYAAFAAAGSLPALTALDVLLEAARILAEEKVAGGMGFVIGMTRPAIEELLRSVEPDPSLLSIATENAGQQFVLTGTASAVGKALEKAAPDALRAERLPISWPMHSPLLRPVAERLERFVAKLPVREPRRATLVSPMLGRPVHGADEAKSVLGRQIAEPARWGDALRALAAGGYLVFAEMGPGDVLTKMLRWTVRSAQGVVLEEPDGLDAFAAACAAPPVLPAEDLRP